MKVYAQGELLGDGKLTPQEALSYVLSLEGVSTVVVGCSNPRELAENVRIAREFQPLGGVAMSELEQRTAGISAAAYYKKLDLRLLACACHPPYGIDGDRDPSRRHGRASISW